MYVFFSPQVDNPPADIIDPDEWKDWFEQRFGPVFMVTVCLSNAPLLNDIKLKRTLERYLRLECIEQSKYEVTKLRASEADDSYFNQLKANQSSKPLTKRMMEYVGEFL